MHFIRMVKTTVAVVEPWRFWPDLKTHFQFRFTRVGKNEGRLDRTGDFSF